MIQRKSLLTKKFNKLKNMSGRIFEVLSCKSFLLTEYNPSLEYFLNPGKT